MIITSFFWKLTKVSTNNLKADIKGTFCRLKCAKISLLFKSALINCQEILCYAALEILRDHYLIFFITSEYLPMNLHVKIIKLEEVPQPSHKDILPNFSY